MKTLITANAKPRFKPENIQILAYVLIIIGVTIQQYLLGKYNNYLMFARPFLMLLDGQNPYIEHPEYFFDIYKYSPTCALFFGVFQMLPDWLGLFFWNALNVVVLVTACKKILPPSKNKWLLWFIIIDTITSVQNSQSNCLLVGLMMWVYINLENKKIFMAVLCLAFAAYIKIYGIAAGVLIIFYPDRWKSIFYAVITFVVFAILPLILVSAAELISLYRSWFGVVNESATRVQLSVMGVLEKWTGLQINARLIQMTGLIILLIPLWNFKMWTSERYRQIYLSALLVFVVVFNQMSESPTFIIAVSGFYLWILFSDKMNNFKYALTALVIVFTSLSATDLFPHHMRELFFSMKIKAVPMIIAWIAIMTELYIITFFNRLKPS